MDLRKAVLTEIVKRVSEANDESVGMYAILLDIIETKEKGTQKDLSAQEATKEEYSDGVWDDDTDGFMGREIEDSIVEDAVEEMISKGDDPMSILLEIADTPQELPSKTSFDFDNFTLTEEEENMKQAKPIANIGEEISKAIVQIVGNNPPSAERLRVARWKTTYNNNQIYIALQKTVRAGANTLRYTDSYLKANYPVEDTTNSGIAPKIRM